MSVKGDGNRKGGKKQKKGRKVGRYRELTYSEAKDLF